MYPSKAHEEMQNQTEKQSVKAKENIHAMIEALNKSDTLPLQNSQGAILRNGFTGTNASPAQQADLLNFREIGQGDFDSFVDHVYLRTGNLKVSVKLNRLKTFSTTTKKVTKHQYARLESEKKHVTQCLYYIVN